MSEVEELQKNFGLKKPNFILDPIEDAEFYAPRTGIDLIKLREDLETDLVTGRAPKWLFWGPYGSGKTHTLRKVMKELEKKTPLFSVFVECPDMTRRSTFVELYRDGIMANLGAERTLELFQKMLEDMQIRSREELLRNIKDKLSGDEELARAVVRLIDPNFDEFKLWNWISGMSVSQPDLRDMGQRQNLADATPSRLAEILIIISRLVRQTHGSTMIVILDEMERVRVLEDTALGTFRTAFTRLTELNQTSLSLLIGASAQQMGDLSSIFAAAAPGRGSTEVALGPVSRRLGPDAFIEIPAMDADDIDEFLKALISYIREPSLDVSERIKVSAQQTSEQLTDAFYPVTMEALDALLGRIITPGELILRLTKALGRAYRQNRVVITSQDCA
jgi:DNA polymerase III delta prime subunit